ncbi:MAG: response regulator [Myxococcales bacterium]|nr:response regulator [Myxococcales bacterium]
MSQAAPHVVVAHDSATIREAMRRLLVEAGYRVTAVGDGHAAAALLAERPAALVLDVAIGGLFAFALLERVRAERLPIRAILVASVYNRTGYKRRPTSLYGADDYVEQHHIPDSLVEKLVRLIGAAPAPGPAALNPLEQQYEAIRQAGEAQMDMPMRYPSKGAGPERARRLARLIVADVALYNGGALGRGDPHDPRLRLDLEEGRLLFELRVPEEVRRGHDFLGEALAEWQHERSDEAAPSGRGEKQR